MKITIILYIATIVGFVLQSCCKQMCMDDEIFSIVFHGFNATELEKIKVAQYNHDNFTTATDSFYVNTSNVVFRDTTLIYLDKPLANDFNFKIVVENAGLMYALSDIQVKKEKCSCGPGTWERIIGYKLNGVLKSEPTGMLVLKK